MEGQDITTQPQFTRRATVALAALALATSLTGTAYADAFDDQITALRQQAATQQASAGSLHAQADGYQARVNELRAQTASLQSQIRINQLKFNKTTAQVEAAKVQLAAQKSVLAENIKAMYVDSGVSPIEMLASSNDMGEFFNQQQYQDKVKNKIQDTMAQVVGLKQQLEKEQRDLTQILSDQKAQQQQLAAAQAEVNNLLAVASANAATADAQVRAANTQITSLKAQQAAVLAARFASSSSGFTGGGTCGGGYPGRWCNATQDSVIDNWGMYNRECVSYTAFRVAASGRRMPYFGGRGNANQWPSTAESFGIPVDSNPKVGDVAIAMAGPYGHAMYVEAVSGGKIHVSQYNYGNNGEYSEMTISSAGLYFLHF